jgi:hypothetical protein
MQRFASLLGGCQANRLIHMNFSLAVQVLLADSKKSCLEKFGTDVIQSSNGWQVI